MTRVSIIVPVYNVELYIVECLQSVVNQTINDYIECIVVDDKGSDNSMQVAETFINSLSLEKQRIFKIVKHEKNGGLSAARNTGIKEATGEYLYFLDSDDYLIPTAMEHLLSLADKYDGVDLLPALYLTGDNRMSQFGAHSFPEFSDNRKLIKTALLNYDRIPVTAANRLVRREFFLENSLWFKEGIVHEDNYWTFFLAKYVKRMAFTPEKIYYYRTTEGSITKAPNRDKETKAFTTFIRDFSANIDSFLPGNQKTLILYNLITLLDNHYYKDDTERDELIKVFQRKNSLVERKLLHSFLRSRNTKHLHLLIRIYQGSYMGVLRAITNKVKTKLWHELNPRFRKYIINPYLRWRMWGANVTLLCNNCNGACILHDCGLQFNSPFVNLWLYPKDFIKYCSDVKHYTSQNLVFISTSELPDGYTSNINHPVARLDDIDIYFKHYATQEQAEKKWVERTARMDFTNIHAILVERDGCTFADMKYFDTLPIHKTILTQHPHLDLSSAIHIKGFEKEQQLGLLMDIMPNQYLGRKYYDQFNYVKFLKS